MAMSGTLLAPYPAMTHLRHLSARSALATFLLTGPALTATWQDLDAVRAAAERAVTEAAGGSGATVHAHAQPLDQRLRLPNCDRDLDTQLPLNTKMLRSSVEVRCTGTAKWKIYVSVSRVETRRILVAARRLARGKVLTSDDILLTEREIDAPGRSYLADANAVVGQTLRRSLEEGEPLPGGTLDAPVAIRAGDEVSLESGSSGFRVRATAVARTAGGLGQTITVQNSSSGRVVQAIVRTEKMVEVALP